MRTPGHRLGTWALTLAVLTVGLAATAGVSLDLHGRDAAEAQRRFDARTELVTSAVEREAERYVVALELVAGALAAGGPVTGARFDAATGPMVDVDFQGATSIAFISSYVATDQVARAWCCSPTPTSTGTSSRCSAVRSTAAPRVGRAST